MENNFKIVIELSGGLGNQLFQFGVGIYLLSKLSNVEIRYDKSNFKLETTHEGFLLNDFINQARNYNNNCCSFEYKSHLIKKINYAFAWMTNCLCVESVPYQYQNDLLTKRWIYLSGYWQTYKYLQGNSTIEIINDVLKSKYSNLYHNKDIKINNKKIIAVHVRRGDYLHNKNIGYGILPIQYYINAMNFIRKKNIECRFLIFSDDYEYIKKFFDYKDCAIAIDLYESGSAMRDLYLMSICDGMISANSSLSWWGGILQESDNVITPTKWFLDRNESQMKDLFPSKWIKIEI